MSIRIGTRASALALWQANWVADGLRAAGHAVELITLKTQGDLQQEGPIAALGMAGIFTKELQKALLDGRIDVAVHSLKDLPTDEVPGLVLAAVPLRETVNDVLISRAGETLAALPRGARIGTGSLRRRSQLLHVRPDLQMHDVRGNVDTRLRKLREGQYEALVLAAAGLTRLNLAEQITEVLPPSVMLSAVGQGALGIETRADDAATRAAVTVLDDQHSHRAVIAERSLLAALRGGCLAPVGAWGRSTDDGRLLFSACVLSRDGARRLAAERIGDASDAVQLGRQVAEDLLAQGAGELIESARGSG